MIRHASSTVALVFLWAGALGAQPLIVESARNDLSEFQPSSTFEELAVRLEEGDAVAVVDASGTEVSGRVAAISAVAVALTVDGVRQEFAADRIQRIYRRRQDPVKNGLLIGAAAGAVAGFSAGRSADSSGCPRSGSECGQGALIGTVGGAFWGAVGGWIVDLLIRKRETIYQAVGSR
jgi:hypothetical protein